MLLRPLAQLGFLESTKNSELPLQPAPLLSTSSPLLITFILPPTPRANSSSSRHVLPFASQAQLSCNPSKLHSSCLGHVLQPQVGFSPVPPQRDRFGSVGVGPDSNLRAQAQGHIDCIPRASAVPVITEYSASAVLNARLCSRRRCSFGTLRPVPGPRASTSLHMSPFTCLPAFFRPFQLHRVGFAMFQHTSFAAYRTSELSNLVQFNVAAKILDCFASSTPKISSSSSWLSSSSMAAVLNAFESSFNLRPRNSACLCLSPLRTPGHVPSI